MLPSRIQDPQKGAVPILVLVAAIGVVAVLVISSIAPFRDGLFYALFPKNSSQAVVDEWTQDGHDAQRTGVTSEEPATPWTYKWSFNGPDGNGGTSGHIYDAPKEARTVTGGAHIYVPAGSKGIFALRKTDGSIAWNITNTSFNATPAYDPVTQAVIVGGVDGQVYKINANTGSILGTFNTGSPINKSVLLNGGFAYVVSDNGNLNKVAISNVSPVWTYVAGATAATLPAYSASRDSIIFATDDLYVHAVNNSNGTGKWRVKPSPNSPGGETATSIPQTYGGVKTGNQFELGWPVIAEKSGIVLVRMQLVLQAHFEGPNGGRFANTNSENRNWLIQNPQYKNLFALNLDNGAEKFIPAVGYGSTEDWINDPAAYGVMGSQPAVKLLPDGKEVAYIHFRNGQTSPVTDFRWSGHMGEMVLDDSTIPGLAAGDLRFVKMSKYQDAPGKGNCDTHIIDEQTPLTMGGSILINAHWANNCSVKITDRTNARGLTANDPIMTSPLPPIIRAQRGSCADKNTSTHYSTCNAQYLTDGGVTGDGRYYGGPGFWGYWNVADPPGWRIGSGNTAGNSYSAGFLPRYTYVSDGQLIVEGNGGEILVFKHSGAVASTAPSISPSPSIIPSPSTVSSASPSSNNAALVFDGVDDTAQTVGIYSNSAGTQTMEVWVKPLVNNAYGMIMSTRNDADNQGWLLELRNGQAELWIADTAGTDRNLLNTATTLTANNWYHIAATYNSSTKIAQIFVNGVPGSTANLNTLSQGPRFRLGTFGGGGFAVYKACNCQIDEIRISNTIRYTSTFTPVQIFSADANTLALYHFNEGSGQNAVDVSGNNNQLILGTGTSTEAADPFWVALVAATSSPSSSPLPSVNVSPTLSPSPKPGDVDGNNKVDIFDYNILLTNFGKTGAGIHGDLDANNKIDIFDYNILLTNFGK